ncbi:Threonine/homoserine/homoserine lactone efflux protein [Pseudomonas congelans]|uniref:Lysine exporter protein n=1 Tax=Pseudomonas congelans TaxID=200452 RepID=A0A0N8R2K7_9PSED|nr:LysE family translocator [Pseudomonas congelans]KPW87062.1 Lysine exporter protein [Pseudomonas congelans]SDP87463.1 Threonine/homoserine/homoserine lactone efflux protein [Pseudomonas congelans]
MESLQQWLSFAMIALFVTLTPGPAVIMALSNSITHGPARAMVGSLGNALGLIVVATAVTAGLGAVLVASASAFLVLKIAGAGYLVYLGIKQWRSARSAFDALANVPKAVSTGSLFIKGISVALTNPKAILFFIAFLPQFIQPGTFQVEQTGVLIVTFAGCSVVAHVFYVLLAQTLKRHLNSARRRQNVNRVFGVSFIGLGLSLFTLKGRAA